MVGAEQPLHVHLCSNSYRNVLPVAVGKMRQSHPSKPESPLLAIASDADHIFTPFLMHPTLQLFDNFKI